MDEQSPIQMNDRYSFNLTSANMTTVLQKVFTMMTGGLLLTALAAYITATVPVIQNFVYSTFLIWIIAEVALVLFLSFRLSKMGSGTAMLSFVLYSIVNGVTLSSVFLVYELGSIAVVFLITAGMFGVMAIIGKTTKMDLTKFGSFLMMGLIGLIIASLVNLFLGSETFNFWIAIVGIVIFIGLTAYDVQKIKNMSANISGTTDEEMIKKLSVIGALDLYLDFINIFLKLLQLMGKRRD